ncbi:unnamed protein product [Pleuronectes platessa]|uniref:Uncharacterized protein n=1 Tax=Pleuronectes platessa TaxID=8262 RepID=A0A9N7YAM7_PLEPL|nr:unnamed protein product [Pleuronectes platessa]
MALAPAVPGGAPSLRQPPLHSAARMKSAAGGAAVPQSSASSDNNAGRRRQQQHRAPSPATAQEGATKRASRQPGRCRSSLAARSSSDIGVKESPRAADGRKREPESRGSAAVQPDGAEAGGVRPNRADAVEEDPAHPPSPARRAALHPPRVKGDSGPSLLSSAYPGKVRPADRASTTGVEAACQASVRFCGEEDAYRLS